MWFIAELVTHGLNTLRACLEVIEWKLDVIPNEDMPR